MKKEAFKRLSQNNTRSLVFSALFLALALVLPFFTGQIPQIGKSLCPMHFPVLLCGFFCGPWVGLMIGMVAPLLRSFLFGMPALMPDAVVMCFELGTYGLVTGLLYKVLPKKKSMIYCSLLGGMLAGRIVWGIVRTILYGLGQSEFGVTMFITIGFVNALPGIILQILLIPVLVMAMEGYHRQSIV